MLRTWAGRATVGLALAGLLSWSAHGLPAGGQPVSPASISLKPACPLKVATGGTTTLTVTGSNFNPFTAVLVTYDAGPGGRPESVAGRTDGFGRFSIDLHPGARPAGPRTVRADDFRDREATADFFVPCNPSLVLSPPIGPPGFVTEAIGRDFPAGAAVRLSWSPGISDPRPVVADGKGRFRVPVLIFAKDVRGLRRLRAEPAGPVAFGKADAPFLVVRRTFVFPGAP